MANEVQREERVKDMAWESKLPHCESTGGQARSCPVIVRRTWFRVRKTPSPHRIHLSK